MADNSLRFAIGDDEPLSEIWTVTVNRSDVYLSSSGFNSVMKLSLHQSGVCQMATSQQLYEERLSVLEGGPDSRTVLRWKRCITPDTGGALAARIIFAACGRWPNPSTAKASKPPLLLPCPPEGYGVELTIFYSKEDPRQHTHDIQQEMNLISVLKLANDDCVSFFGRFLELPGDFFSFRRVPKGQTLATVGFDQGGGETEWGDLSSYEILQDFENAATIYSLHNMQLKRMAR
ncbi:hypothetical protein ASE23_11935 [Rhizobium sp. Root73]|uniref:hypothetical protein n=1 Tax=unclassified Rhizobium TaxID=2613769 RepID=UPI000728E211|nr:MULTISPECIES: hypothetical protein [unclassified Rhizobium]KQY03520.1 hypothetical protein ASD36_14125 [Rhizobium sp. Root1334]KRC00168.1 hypothetical protein ASE23_11935 [Rhizobium sp. Root73]